MILWVVSSNLGLRNWIIFQLYSLLLNYTAKEDTVISIAFHLVSLFCDPLSDDTMDWIYLVQWGTFTKTLMKFPVLNEARNLLTIKGIIASPKGSSPWNYWKNCLDYPAYLRALRHKVKNFTYSGCVYHQDWSRSVQQYTFYPSLHVQLIQLWITCIFPSVYESSIFPHSYQCVKGTRIRGMKNIMLLVSSILSRKNCSSASSDCTVPVMCYAQCASSH